MVVLDLFPAGILQFEAVVENGLWYGRSATFLESEAFQTLTWMRIIGGSIFVVGGVIPLTWAIASVARHFKSSPKSKNGIAVKKTSLESAEV